MDAKEFRVLMWGIVKFSMNSCFRFVQKHPTVSGVLLILSVLYLFLPSVFYLLIYASPVLVCTGVFIRFYLSTRRPQFQNAVKDEKRDDRMPHVKSKSLPADVIVDEDGGSSIQANGAFDGETKDPNTKVVEKEAEMVSSRATRNNSIGITAVVGGKPKRKVGNKERVSSKLGGRHSCNVSVGDNLAALGEAVSEPDLKSIAYSYEQGTKFPGGFSEAEMESSDSEEDAPEGAKKPMEWTEDDQKNLMDLGFSEIERNKRLESLIARRRAKKLFKTNTEKGMIDMDAAPPQYAHLLVARSNPFEFPNICDEQMPGSAPSVLLPNQNPFDFPYDSLEEIPDLMKDHFQQEFMTTHQKEMLFCRHESFCLGPFFPPERLHELTGYSMFQRPSDKGDHDRQVEHSFQVGRFLSRNLSATDLVAEDEGITNQPQPNREGGSRRVETNTGKMENDHDRGTSLGNGIETQMKTDTLKHNKDGPKPRSSLEDGESNFNANRRDISENQILLPTGFKFPELHSPAHNSCPLPKARVIIEPSYNSSLSVVGDIRSEDHSFYPHRGNWHTPNNSIASDMQVEVSEVGSPPLTADGTASSDDGESLTYDGDVEKEITSGSDEMLGLSPHAPRAEELETALREKRASHEDLRRRFTGNRKETHGTRASSVTSVPATNGPRRKERAHSEGYDRTTPHSAGQVNEEGKEGHSNHVDATPTEISLEHMQPLEDSTPYATPEAHLEKAQEQLNPFEKSASEVNISHDVDDSAHNCNDGKVVKSNEDRDGGIQSSVGRNMSKLASEGNSESSKHVDRISSTGTPENPAEELNINYNVEDPVLPTNDHVEDLKRVADNDGNSEKPTESVATQNIPIPVQGQEGLISNLESQQQKSTSEVGARMEIQTSNHATTPNTQQEFADEQANASSISSSSPKSVIPDKATVEQRLSSDLNHQVQNVIPTPRLEENMSRNELMEVNAAQNLILAESQSDGHEAKASIPSTSIDCNTGSSMETSDTPEQTKSNKHLPDDREIENPKPSKNLHDQSTTAVSDEAASKLSKPPEKVNHGAVEHIEGIASMGHSDHGVNIKQSKPKEELDGTKVLDIVITEKESTNLPPQLSGDANITSKNFISPKVDKEVNVDKLRTIDGKDSAGHEDVMESLRQTDSASREIEDGNEPSGASSKSSEENYDSSSNNNFEDFVNVIQHLHDQLIDVMTPGGSAATSEAAMTFRGAVKDSTELETLKTEDERDHINDVHNSDGRQELHNSTLQDP